MRICARMGWSLPQWQSLNPRERLDWLAWDYRRESKLADLRNTLTNLKYPDPGSLIAIIMAQME